MIRVSVIEDQREIRDGLCLLIASSPAFELAGSYATMEDALTEIEVTSPDVALVDIALPGMSGIEGISHIHRCAPKVAVIVLTVFEDDDKIFQALCEGAAGYLLKKSKPDKILEGIREVVEGGAPMSPEVARRVLTTFQQGRRNANNGALTPHELRLLRMMVEGHNHTTAAAELKVTPHAISYHMRSIYHKLQVHNKKDAVVKALRDGLVR